jgi:hypothetical protein
MMGYDPRAIKVPKSVKRIAATVADKDMRRSLIKSYATAIKTNQNTRPSKVPKAN